MFFWRVCVCVLKVSLGRKLNQNLLPDVFIIKMYHHGAASTDWLLIRIRQFLSHLVVQGSVGSIPLNRVFVGVWWGWL